MNKKVLWIVEGVLIVGGLAALVSAFAVASSTDKKAISASEETGQRGQDVSASAETSKIEIKSSTTSQRTSDYDTSNVVSGHQLWQNSASADRQLAVDNRTSPVAVDHNKESPIAAPTVINVEEASIEDLIESLGRLKGEDLEKAVKRLAEAGEAGLKLLVAELQQDGQTYGFRHQAVRVLEMMNTPESRSILKDMALGNHTDGNPNLERWAAQAYLTCAGDQHTAADLLESKAGPVLNLALLRLRGVSPDASLMERIGQLSTSPDRAVRTATALVLADDPSPRYPAKSVDTIASAVLVAGRQEDAAKHDVGYGYYTNAEREYSVYMNALSEMHVSDDVLRRQATKDDGQARDLLYIALGRRGDGTSRSALVKVVAESKNGMIRAWAADALGLVGARSDVALLNRLRESDPEVRKNTDGPLPTTVYPVREAAARAVTAIEKRTSQK